MTNELNNIKKRIYNIPFLTFKTHAVVYGDINEGTPIILLHGGPGGCSEKYESLIRIAKFNPIIFYDQLGSGYSKVEKGHFELWNFDTFIYELEILIKYFHLKKYILLGHSWGGMLALKYCLTTKHHGLKKLILFSTLPSTKMWNEEHLKDIKSFPDAYKNPILAEYNNEPFDPIAHKKAVKYFYQTHVGKKADFVYKCQRKRFPKLNKEVYEYMWGPSELFGTGTLKDYDVISELKNIDVPTLIISGKYDESTPAMNDVMNKEIKNSKWVLLPSSHHCGYNEEPELVLKAIQDFLNN